MRLSGFSFYVRSGLAGGILLSVSGWALGREGSDETGLAANRQAGDSAMIYDFEVLNAADEAHSLARYRGRVLLIVNTASKCGFTPQYEGLEKLHRQYAERGLAVLAFPCNQFGFQEPKDNPRIQEFCSLNYGVTFPVLAKLKVNGDDAHPLFKYLKSADPTATRGKAIRWNFTKFLVDREGVVTGRYGSRVKPLDLVADIEKLLGDE